MKILKRTGVFLLFIPFAVGMSLLMIYFIFRWILTGRGGEKFLDWYTTAYFKMLK